MVYSETRNKQTLFTYSHKQYLGGSKKPLAAEPIWFSFTG